MQVLFPGDGLLDGNVAGKLVRTAARFDGALPEAQRDYCARRPPPDFENKNPQVRFRLLRVSYFR